MNSAKENPSFLVFLIVSVFSTNVFGTVYYVSKTGNDFNTCAQARNKAFPKLTISAGIKCLSSGDTLYIRSGTYYEAINEYKVSIPSGTSWQSPVTIAGYPGEKIILQPCTGETEVLRLMGYTAGTQYVVFDNLTLDGINNIANIVKITYTGNNPNHCSNHIRIKNCEIKNARHNGIYVDSQSGNNEFINLKIHDNGSSDFDHGLYITGNNNLIKKCDIYQNAGWGIHIYNEL